MSLVLVLIVIAVVVGGVALLVEGLKWLLIIAAVLFVIGLLSGFRARSSV